jgi:predicted exporter
MVFSTTLIGIGIDYSYHYFFAEEHNKKFIKNLTCSLITSIIPFVLLYLTEIELLEQISVFTVFGLIAIYLVVLLVYPCFILDGPKINITPKLKIYKALLLVLVLAGLSGYSFFHFNDSLSSMYTPDKKLRKAEYLYGDVSGVINIKTKLISVEGKNLDDIIQKEEKITEDLYKKDIPYIALSSFIPSAQRQKENFNLVKELYETNLNKYSDILSKSQIKELKNLTFTPVVFDIKDYNFLSEYSLDDTSSDIIAVTDKDIEVKGDGISIINFKKDVEQYIKSYRNILLKTIPCVILALFILLSIFCGYKNAVKVLIPSVTGIICSVGITCLITGEMNLFGLISAFMVLGFTMDYSIFRLNKEIHTENAILVSGITTMFSFLLLSFCGFKLLSSISLILFFGILVSYLTGYFVFSKTNE